MSARFLLLGVLGLMMAALALGAEAPATPTDLLVPVEQARRVGYAPLWASALAVTPRGSVAFAGVLGDLLVTVETPHNLVTAFAVKDGAVRWRQAVASGSDRAIAALRLDNDILIATQTEIFVLRAENGRLTKRSRLEQSCSAAPTLVGPLAVVGGMNGRVHAHDATTGFAKWAYQLTNEIAVPPLPIDRDVFVVDKAGHMALLGGRDGKVIWRNRTFGAVTAAPAYGQRTVLVASQDQSLYALDAQSGKDRWIFRSTEVLTRSPLVHADRVFQPLPSGQLVALGLETGKELWRVPRTPQAMLPLAQGLLLVGADQLEVLDPATGRPQCEARVPDGIAHVLAGPDKSLLVISPRGRILRLNPMP